MENLDVVILGLMTFRDLLRNTYFEFEQDVITHEKTLVCAALLSYNLNTLESALESARNYYYQQAWGQLRMVFENCTAIEYVNIYPKEAKRWLIDDYDMVSNAPRHGIMLSKLRKHSKNESYDKELVKKRLDHQNKTYADFCKSTHTNSICVVPYLSIPYVGKVSTDDIKEIKLYVYYDEGCLIKTYFYINCLISINMDIIIQTLKRGPDNNYTEDFERIRKLLLKTASDINNEKIRPT